MVAVVQFLGQHACIAGVDLDVELAAVGLRDLDAVDHVAIFVLGLHLPDGAAGADTECGGPGHERLASAGDEHSTSRFVVPADRVGRRLWAIVGGVG